MKLRYKVTLPSIILQHLKEALEIDLKFKLNVFREDGHGKGKPGYVQKEYKIQEIVEGKEAEFLHANMNTIFVEELHLTTLGLLAVGI